jgi:hypothetical protein
VRPGAKVYCDLQATGQFSKKHTSQPNCAHKATSHRQPQCPKVDLNNGPISNSAVPPQLCDDARTVGNVLPEQQPLLWQIDIHHHRCAPATHYSISMRTRASAMLWTHRINPHLMNISCDIFITCASSLTGAVQACSTLRLGGQMNWWRLRLRIANSKQNASNLKLLQATSYLGL